MRIPHQGEKRRPGPKGGQQARPADLTPSPFCESIDREPQATLLNNGSNNISQSRNLNAV